jgi:hypothetical protein
MLSKQEVLSSNSITTKVHLECWSQRRMEAHLASRMQVFIPVIILTKDLRLHKSGCGELLWLWKKINSSKGFTAFLDPANANCFLLVLTGLTLNPPQTQPQHYGKQNIILQGLHHKQTQKHHWSGLCHQLTPQCRQSHRKYADYSALRSELDLPKSPEFYQNLPPQLGLMKELPWGTGRKVSQIKYRQLCKDTFSTLQKCP